ncbi:DUF3891 family protein [Saccharibacillus sp. CPCC 101409]|uniref:DUF3891 family protein n=1 Tax=Saccharibacillus sp. CPCC 101409 TaxID=3058041 RepID=UPI002673712F|nr:DUF3891 family protein [Saccharibacillus sp. CPCC 101409]MDO3408334.1 DUF3891 family protein [Saccharibacillus sp. CPCC 101409]
MIVRETDQSFVLVKQHDHAKFSGEAAERFADKFYMMERVEKSPGMPEVTKDAIVLGVTEHDRGWIRPDDTAVWDDHLHAPYSFNEYPMLPKVTFYQMGIDELEEKHPYAALLSSLYYSVFEDIQTSEREDCVAFVHHEEERQQRIRSAYTGVQEETLLLHRQVLQTCDGLSLYVCLNAPGIGKEDEHPWFKDGVPGSEPFGGGGLLQLSWQDDRTVKADPSPFDREFTATLREKHVPKDRIREVGVAKAYEEAEWTEREITFV